MNGSRNRQEKLNNMYFEKEDEEEEEDDYSDEEDDDDIDKDKKNRSIIKSQKQPDDMDEDIPLHERLEKMKTMEHNKAFHSINDIKKYAYHPSSRKDIKSNKNKSVNKTSQKEKKDKNAPTTRRSNRPVPILRDNIFTQKSKLVDPRFSEATGKLDYDKFIKRYSFLDEAQEQEIQSMERKLKKTKNIEIKEEIKKEMYRTKQQLVERRRKVKINQKVKEIYSQESEKVKNGKKPFFLKRSAIKEIELNQRYDELKKDGKLNHFLMKKRKRNASKDHKLIPSRRIGRDE